MPSEPVITSVLIARLQFLDPLVLSLFLPPPTKRRREEVFFYSYEAAHPAWLPGSPLLTAGPQEPYSVCWVVKGLLPVFHSSYQGPAVSDNVC